MWVRSTTQHSKNRSLALCPRWAVLISRKHAQTRLHDFMPDITCAKFGDVLSRRSEHLDDEIIRSRHPMDDWVAHVSTGKFPTQAGVEHTFDRFENVFPDMTGAWEDVQAQGCIGQPCDPDSKKIGMGFTRDSYRLQRKAFETALFCWDLILSADRAKEQYAHFVRTLRRASVMISADRMRHEAVRIAGQKWATTLAGNKLTPITAYWNSTGTVLNVSTRPTSKISARHLQRRVQPQILLGALGDTIQRDMAPRLEYVNDMESIWDMVEGDPALTDRWRFNDFGDEGQKFYKYGWTGTVGNYGMRADSMPLRFLDRQQQNTDGTWQLQLVYPYTNVDATEGIKEALNEDYQNAHIQANFIWHRLAMTNLVRDTTSINPMMPFGARDFAGKWIFGMDNLTCGTDDNGNPIAVDNVRRNKGKFIADFSLATKSNYPEFAELFLTLREPACIVGLPTCSDDPGYPVQDYNSANAACPTDAVVLTDTPILSAGGTYEIAENTIQCSGIQIVHSAITGTSTLTTLVAQLNDLVGALGTWAVSGGNITLTTTACTSFAMPWTQA